MRRSPIGDGLTWEDVDGLAWPDVDRMPWIAAGHVRGVPQAAPVVCGVCDGLPAVAARVRSRPIIQAGVFIS